MAETDQYKYELTYVPAVNGRTPAALEGAKRLPRDLRWMRSRITLPWNPNAFEARTVISTDPFNIAFEVDSDRSTGEGVYPDFRDRRTVGAEVFLPQDPSVKRGEVEKMQFAALAHALEAKSSLVAQEKETLKIELEAKTVEVGRLRLVATLAAGAFPSLDTQKVLKVLGLSLSSSPQEINERLGSVVQDLTRLRDSLPKSDQFLEIVTHSGTVGIRTLIEYIRKKR